VGESSEELEFMLTNRRAFLGAVGASTVGLASGAQSAKGAARQSGIASRIKLIAFDGFPIIDPRPVAAEAEERFPGQGQALMEAWRTRQFEYTWLRTLSGNYQDFWHTTQDALTFAAASTGIKLTPDVRDTLMHTYLALKAWPDALPALQQLRNAGIRMAFLSNLTAPMLDAAVRNAGLESFFEPHLSTDRVRAFKPDPRAYAMALKTFRVSREEVVFCASAGWDAAGARLFGYRTFWINRSRQPAEELGAKPDGIGTSMADFVSFLLPG
jgi:2-haloacid dehalogenase